MGQVSSAGFLYQRAITIDKTKVQNTSQINFPVLVSGTYDGSASTPDLRTIGNGGKVSNASGYDVGFYAEPACVAKLAWETEKYTASTGEVIYWVKIPVVSTVSNTTFYLCYGNSAISTDQSSAANVWDPTGLVAHLPNGSSLTATNSITGSAGTVSGTTAATGQIDGAALTDGINDDIDWGDINALDGLTTLTVSMWVKPTDTAVEFEHYLDKTDASSGWAIQTGGTGVGTNTSIGFIIFNGSTMFALTDTGRIASGVWTLIHVVYNGALVTDAQKVQIFTDGVSRTLTFPFSAAPSVIPGNAITIALANPKSSGDSWGKATFDEVRAVPVARSADWVKTEYNNQFSPSTFYSIGSEIAGSVTRAPVQIRGKIKIRGRVLVR